MYGLYVSTADGDFITAKTYKRKPTIDRVMKVAGWDKDDDSFYRVVGEFTEWATICTISEIDEI